jgi:hypothetical protein
MIAERKICPECGWDPQSPTRHADQHILVPDEDQDPEELEEEVDALRNALFWIHYIAGMHYIGQAFEPDHMRALSNLAADALAGKDLPDYEEAMKKARVAADHLMEDLLIDDDAEANDHE